MGIVDEKQVLVGNRDLFLESDIQLSDEEFDEPYTYVHVGVDGEHVGTISIADQIKEDSKQAIDKLKKQGIEQLVIFSGDVGIAMGGIGSDATVETADVVIQTDQPSKIPIAIDIAHFTHRVVWQPCGKLFLLMLVWP